MFTSNPVAVRARTVYHAAADCYDLPALSFWGRFGRTTVERLKLRPGQQVLDVCCGSGACGEAVRGEATGLSTTAVQQELIFSLDRVSS